MNRSMCQKMSGGKFGQNSLELVMFTTRTLFLYCTENRRVGTWELGKGSGGKDGKGYSQCCGKWKKQKKS